MMIAIVRERLKDQIEFSVKIVADLEQLELNKGSLP